jgi:hypothetical protein
MVPLDQAVVVTANRNSPRFLSLEAVFEAGALTAGGTQRLTLKLAPTDAKRGGIEIRLPEGAVYDGMAWVRQVGVDPRSGATQVQLNINRELRDMAPGTYRVSVSTRDLAWESDSVVVNAGEMTVVKVERNAHAAVQVEVVNEQGEPLRDAVLLRDALAGPDFGKPAQYADGVSEARSNARGIARLDRQPAGQRGFAVHAKGYEPGRFEAMLLPGEVVDAGRVVLRKARGVLHIRIKNRGAVGVLTARCGVNLGMQGPKVTIEGDSHTFEGLPLGAPYTVILHTPEQAKSLDIYNNVWLDEREPEKTIELDAAKHKDR